MKKELYYHITKFNIAWLLLFLIANLMAFPLTTSSNTNLELKNLFNIPIGAGGNSPSSIVINPTTNRAYVLNEFSQTVSVIDTTENKLIASILIAESRSKLAINFVTNRLYVVGTKALTIIDSDSNLILSKISLPTSLFFTSGNLAINESNNQLYLVIGENIILAFDGSMQTFSQILKVDTDTRITGIAVNPTTKLIYVTNSNSSEGNKITVIDSSSNNIKTVIKLTNTSFVSSIIVNPITNKIYAINIANSRVDSGILVIDGNTDKIITTIVVANATSEITINQKTNTIYLIRSVPDSTKPQTNSIVIIDLNKDMIVGSTDLDFGSQFRRELAVNTSNGNIFITSSNNNTVSIFDATVSKLISELVVGNKPNAITLNKNSNFIYVANFSTNTVSVIDAKLNRIVKTINVGIRPIDIAINDSSNLIYVVNNGSNSISVIDSINNTVIDNIAVGNSPEAIAINSNTNQIYVIDSFGVRVSVIDTTENKIINTIDTSFANAITVNQTTNKIYVTKNSFFGTGNGFIVIDGISNAIIATAEMDIRNFPNAIAVNPLTNRIYMTELPEPGFGFGNLFVFDANDNSLLEIIDSVLFPQDIEIDIPNNLVYVVDSFFSSISIMDGITNEFLSDIDVGFDPRKLVINPVTKQIYAVNLSEDTVSVIGDGSNITDTMLPLVKDVSPKGGEVVKTGTNFTVSWESSDDTTLANHDILLSTDGGVTFPVTLATGIFGNSNSYPIVLPKNLFKTKMARIRVIATDITGKKGQADSSANFKIKGSKK